MLVVSISRTIVSQLLEFCVRQIVMGKLKKLRSDSSLTQLTGNIFDSFVIAHKPAELSFKLFSVRQIQLITAYE